MKKAWLFSVMCVGLLSLGAQAQQHYGAEDPSMIPKAPYASASYLYDVPVDMADGGQISMHELQFYHLLPLIWDDPLMLNAAADLRWTRLNMKDLGVPNQTLYTVAGRLDVRYEGFYPWTFEGTLKVGLFSELEEINGNAARERGGLRAIYPLTPDLSISAGLAYDEVFGDDQWYPVGGVTWTPEPEWEIRLQYPDSRISFAPTPSLLAYLEAAAAGRNWNTHIRDQQYTISMESVRYGGGIEYALDGDLWLRVSGGIQTDRHFHIWKVADVPLDSSADDNVYVGLALILR